MRPLYTHSFLFAGMMRIWARARFTWLVMLAVPGSPLAGMRKMMMLFDGHAGKEYWADVHPRADNNMAQHINQALIYIDAHDGCCTPRRAHQSFCHSFFF
jgi:hypothetical protein